jgi:hypothetical protein
LKSLPDFLEGFPFIVLWSWGVLSAVTLPTLLAVEIAVCSWLWVSHTAVHTIFWRHGRVVLVGLMAEIVFVLARQVAG